MEKIKSNGELFVTIAEASMQTGLSQTYIRKECREGSLPCLKIGRVYRVNLPALLEKLDEMSKAATA